MLRLFSCQRLPSGSVAYVLFELSLHTSTVDWGKRRNTWWSRALLYGVPFGVITGLFAALQGHRSGVANGLITGIIGGALFGLAMMPGRAQAAG